MAASHFWYRRHFVSLRNADIFEIQMVIHDYCYYYYYVLNTEVKNKYEHGAMNLCTIRIEHQLMLK